MKQHSRLRSALVLLSLTILAGGVLSVRTQAVVVNSCSGTIQTSPNTGLLQIVCDGPACCQNFAGADALGDYYFCGCEPTVEPDCCFTILREPTSAPIYGDAKGACAGSNSACDPGKCGYSPSIGVGECI